MKIFEELKEDINRGWYKNLSKAERRNIFLLILVIAMVLAINILDSIVRIFI